jgi:hypothetical protein
LELGIEEFTSTCLVCSKELNYDVADVEKKLSMALELYDKGTKLRDEGKKFFLLLTDLIILYDLYDLYEVDL